MWDKLYRPMDSLQQGLSAAWIRNAVIRNNIANVETPNFKASDVEFETLLSRAMQEPDNFKLATTHPMHISREGSKLTDISPVIVQRRGLSMRMDGNNVDIEDENVKLVQNSLYYNTLLEKMNSEIRRLRMAINEGR